MNFLFAFIILVTSSISFASCVETQSRNVFCNLESDLRHGLTVPRAYLNYSGRDLIESERICLEFIDYATNPPKIKGTSCGSRNQAYGTRLDDWGLTSIRFDGFENHTNASGISLPMAKRRFAIIQLEGEPSRLVMKADRKESSNQYWICHKRFQFFLQP